MRNSRSHKSSTTWKQSTKFSPAEISQSQIINNMETFNVFFACRIVLAANHHYREKFQRFFRLQNCLIRRSSKPRKYSNSFSPADMSQWQIIKNPKTFKDFFVCRIVSAADDRCSGNIQTLFHLQICLSRKSSTTWKNSKTFSPADFSQTQTINNLETIKDFFACKTVLAANHHYPENIQRLFRLQNCLGRRSSITRKCSKTFSPADLSLPQIIDAPEIFKNFFTCRIVLAANHQQPGNNQEHFRLQNCLGRRSSITRKCSKTFSPADLSLPQIIDAPEIFKNFLTCRSVLAADHQQHGNIQIFSTCRTLLPTNHQQPGNSQRKFHRQKYLSLKLSTTWKHSMFFFACRIVLAANHLYREKIQRLFRLQNCRIRRSSMPRKYSNSFSPADMSQWQIIQNPKIFKHFFT